MVFGDLLYLRVQLNVFISLRLQNHYFLGTPMLWARPASKFVPAVVTYICLFNWQTFRSSEWRSILLDTFKDQNQYNFYLKIHYPMTYVINSVQISVARSPRATKFLITAPKFSGSSVYDLLCVTVPRTFKWQLYFCKSHGPLYVTIIRKTD
jgi:hypothetical protein